MIDRQTVDRVLAATRIVDLIGDYVRLDKRGANYIGLCPFHKEKTPSFSVSESKGIYKCFGCGKGGNALSFIMEIEHLSFVNAIKFLAKRENIPIEEHEETTEERELRTERESLMVVLQWAQAYFHQQLTNTDEGKRIGLAYLQERSVLPETTATFGLGYSPNAPRAFTDAALTAGYKLDYLIKTGLTIAQNGNQYDRFRGRVLFPIQSVSGRTIGFGGRALRLGERTAKYINSPESPVYHKSDTLFGLAQSKQAITKEDKCILVEGYLDVLSLFQRGVTNVVASSGTALTPEQVRLIARFTKNITILYDGDSAGIHAAERGADLFLAEGLYVKLALLPDGQDPDDFAKKNSREQILLFIQQNETDFIRFKTNRLLNLENPDPQQQAALTHDILRSIALVPDDILRAHLLHTTANTLAIAESILAAQLQKLRTKRTSSLRYAPPTPQEQTAKEDSSTKTPAPAQLLPTNPLEESEKELIQLLLLHGQQEFYANTDSQQDETAQTITIASYIIEELDTDDIQLSTPSLARILQEYKELLNGPDTPSITSFTHHPDPAIAQTAVDLSTPRYTLSKRWLQSQTPTDESILFIRAQTERAVLAYKARILDQQYSALQHQLAQGVNPEDEPQILQQLQDLANMRCQLAELINRILL